jgi:hypothetical protein
MTSSTAQIAAETDAQREAKIVAGRTAEPAARKRSTSRASKSAAKSAADKSKPAPAPKPVPKPEPKGPTATEQRDAVFQHLMTAVGEIIEHWDAKSTGISRETAREILSQRLRYTPGRSWDKRLGARVNIASRSTGK